MITPAPGITVLDGMAALAGLRVAGTKQSVPQVELAHPVRRSFEDRVDLSPGCLWLSEASHSGPGKPASRPGSGIGRLIDVLA